MVHLIQEIRQLDINNKHNISIMSLPEKHNQLHALFVQKDQQNDAPVWPTMLQPTNLNRAVYPHNSCKIFTYLYIFN